MYLHGLALLRFASLRTGPTWPGEHVTSVYGPFAIETTSTELFLFFHRKNLDRLINACSSQSIPRQRSLFIFSVIPARKQQEIDEGIQEIYSDLPL
jgi:hypothetical protein